MTTKSLKTIIAVNIFVLLTVAVGLINIVMIATSQRAYFTSRLDDHQMLVDSVRSGLKTDSPDRPGMSEKWRPVKTISLTGSQATAAIAIDRQGDLTASGYDLSGQWHDRLVVSAKQAGYLKKRIVDFEGKTWGVFLPGQEYLIAATPVIMDNTVAAVVGTVYDLRPFYAGQRQHQSIILVYALINILILTALGTMAISRSAIRPIYRLVKRAEEYQESPEKNFFLHREKNEFQQLSGALNRMLHRIADDKQKLRSSLTDLEQANRELKAHQNELIRAEKLASVGRLSAGLAHEIGNPIGIVLGYLDLLNQENLSEAEKQDYISRCRNEVNRINLIIRELLDFSRSSAGASREPVPVHAVIREAVSMLQVQPQARGVRINCFLDAENDCVSAIYDRMRQVLINLILNAMDAVEMSGMKNQGLIEIRTGTKTAGFSSPGGRRLVITVTDNGNGIADADLDNIFDPFFTTKEPGRGTGLGLSVCYMIIEGLDGEIKVSSRIHQGTTFSLYLPLAAAGEITDNNAEAETDEQ